MRESWHGFSNQDVCHVCCLLGVMMNDFNNMQAIIQVLSLSSTALCAKKSSGAQERTLEADVKEGKGTQ